MNLRLPIARGSRPGGFSLTEMLVATGVLLVIVTGLLAMFQQVQKALRRSMTQADVMETGRSVMALLVRDLQEASASGVFGATNFVAVADAGLAKPMDQDLPGGTRKNDFEMLYFLTRQAEQWQAHGFWITNSHPGVGVLTRFHHEFDFTAAVDPVTRCASTNAQYQLLADRDSWEYTTRNHYITHHLS